MLTVHFFSYLNNLIGGNSSSSVIYCLSVIFYANTTMPPAWKDVRFVLSIRLFVGGLMSYLRYLCLFACSGVQHVLCWFFFFFFLHLVYPMMTVSLDCPFLIAPSVFSNVYFEPKALDSINESLLSTLYICVDSNNKWYGERDKTEAGSSILSIWSKQNVHQYL